MKKTIFITRNNLSSVWEDTCLLGRDVFRYIFFVKEFSAISVKIAQTLNYFLLKFLNIFFLFQRKHYVKYAKVFPLSSFFEFKVPSKWYRRSIGILEIFCGILMALIPNCKYIFWNLSNIFRIQYRAFNSFITFR